MKDVKDFELVVFRPPVSTSYRKRYEAAFQFWKGIWKTANHEMVRPTEFPSDPFTRQSEIVCLFRGEEPVALICHRNVDFECESTFEDSAFFPGTWRKEDKDVVRALGGVGVMGSQITVHPDYRASEPLSMKYLIVLLSLSYAQTSGAETVIASIRTAKGLDRLFGGAGSIVIAPERPFFGAHVDLIAFRPQQAAIAIPEMYREPVRELWSRAHFANSLDLKERSYKVERKAA